MSCIAEKLRSESPERCANKFLFCLMVAPRTSTEAVNKETALPGGRHSTAVAFKLRAPAAQVRFSVMTFPRKKVFFLDVTARLTDSHCTA